ncbi:MAG: DUF2268 domain-containing putative Zn-dependent protease, partial [Bacteroidales bacterium]|nr:DUF2268 domain-containing putative Zn-dependent protease [Bacteroidales bacterium]
MIRNWILIFGLLLLIGCENDVPDFERTIIDINGQRFEILSTQAIFENYLKECDNYKDFKKASKKLIFKPIEKEILNGAEASFMINSIKIPYEPTDNLKKQVDNLKSNESIKLIEKALYSITDSIPGPNTKIILLPTSSLIQEYLDKYNLPGYGVAIGSGKIIIALNQTADNWKDFLSFGLAHEYHHSTWISRNWITSDFTLLEYLVFEGRADSFAKSINDSVEVHSTKYITKEQENFVWNLVKPDLDKKGTERLTNVMYG